MRTITLRGMTVGDNRWEGPSKRLSDAEFQAQSEKGLCFCCEENYYARHRCKVKERKELRVLVVQPNEEELEVIEEEDYVEVIEMKTIEIERITSQ